MSICIYSPLQYSVAYCTSPNRIGILDDFCLTEIILKTYSKIDQYKCLKVQRIFSIIKETLQHKFLEGWFLCDLGIC